MPVCGAASEPANLPTCQSANDLSVIIVNWNTRDLLADCLRSIHDTVHDLEYEVFVVDNASTDGSVAMVREQFPAVHLIENSENVGFARANNQAIALATGRYVLLLNSDTVALSGSLQTMVAFADSHPRAGLVGARLLNRDGSFQAGRNEFPTLMSVVAEALGVANLLYGRALYPSYSPAPAEEPALCDWVGGACLLARRSAIAEVGLLDDDFFLNSEEVDWCYRHTEAGWEVWYHPDAAIVHLGGASDARSSGQAKLRLWRGKLLFLRKHRGYAEALLAQVTCRLGAAMKTLAHGLLYLVHRDPDSKAACVANWCLLSSGDLL